MCVAAIPILSQILPSGKHSGIRILNVAGNVRPKSRTALASGIEQSAVEFLSEVFRVLGHEQLHQPSDGLDTKR